MERYEEYFENPVFRLLSKPAVYLLNLGSCC